MKFSIGDIVYSKDKIKKTIVDREIIDGIELYYTSDNSSYSVTQLISENEYQNLFININKDKIISLIDFKKVGNNWANWYERKVI
jgi:hypothetical protein